MDRGSSECKKSKRRKSSVSEATVEWLQSRVEGWRGLESHQRMRMQKQRGGREGGSGEKWETEHEAEEYKGCAKRASMGPQGLSNSSQAEMLNMHMYTYIYIVHCTCTLYIVSIICTTTNPTCMSTYRPRLRSNRYCACTERVALGDQVKSTSKKKLARRRADQ